MYISLDMHRPLIIKHPFSEICSTMICHIIIASLLASCVLGQNAQFLYNGQPFVYVSPLQPAVVAAPLQPATVAAVQSFVSILTYFHSKHQRLLG